MNKSNLKYFVLTLQYAKRKSPIDGDVHISHAELRCICGKKTSMVYITLGKSDIGKFSSKNGLILKYKSIDSALDYYYRQIGRSTIADQSILKKIWNYISTIGD